MSRSRMRILPHLSFAELTQRYQECQNTKTENYWLAILLLSHPDTPLTVEQTAEQLGFSSDWIRKLVRRYNRFGAFSINSCHQQSKKSFVQKYSYPFRD